jgi:hypothetical protein
MLKKKKKIKIGGCSFFDPLKINLKTPKVKPILLPNLIEPKYLDGKQISRPKLCFLI